MLLAVEGGGFFSSSASGYTKGLTLLLLGQKDEEKPMRVTPWNQYQLFEQESNPDLQLASGKYGLGRGCASFVCFGCTAEGPQSPSHLKVGPTENCEVSPRPRDSDESKDEARSVDLVVDVDDDRDKKIVGRKCNLKKPANSDPAAGSIVVADIVNSNKEETLREKETDVACQMERRKVQWPDTTGGELYEIREFEMSEDGSDDEFDHGLGKTCSCSIM